MVGFKKCTRCHGDVQTVPDLYGDYVSCLQCGHVVELVVVKSHQGLSKVKRRPGKPRKRAGARNAA